ncbi:hypothetical protein [Granulicoccus sp. GXG6511]|uniref:hypothetical protein n=1 Tax=Granulicoccus sp. GXG6511 TaxID=3381351 RepID=UPI003D7EDC09
MFFGLLIALSGLIAWRAPGGWGWPHDHPFWAFLAVAVLGMCATHQAWRWSRPDRHRRTSIGIIIGWALWVIVLATISYWPARGQEVWFWAPLFWAINLFAGNVENRWGSGPAPLALQLARLAALVVTFSAVLAVLFALGRDYLDRLTVRWLRKVILVTGVSPVTVPVIEALVATSRPGVRVVVLDRDPDHALKHRIEAAGARVLRGTITDDDRGPDWRLLRRIVLRPGPGRPLALQAAYLLAPDDIANIDHANSLARLIAEEIPPDLAAVPPRLIVRIDHVRLAMDHLRRSIADEPNVLIDTTGLPQVMATDLVATALPGATTIHVRGDTDLAQAFLWELGVHRRTEDLLRAAAGKPALSPTEWPQIFVVGADTDLVIERHQRLCARYGVTPLELEAVVDSTDRPGSRVVLTESGDRVWHEALEMADRFSDDNVLVFVQSADVIGVERDTLMGNLRPYGPTLTVPSVGVSDVRPVELHKHAEAVIVRVAARLMRPVARRLAVENKAVTTLQAGLRVPEDSWTRAARLVHEFYRVAHRDVQWEHLRESLRLSNYRAVSVFFEHARSLDRTWIPRSEESHPLAASDLEAIAQREHESWKRFTEGQHTAYSPKKCRMCRTNDLLLNWDPKHEMFPELRARTVAGLEVVQRVLAALGYQPFRLTWEKWHRSERVTAHRLRRARSWRNAKREPKRAKPGDWWVTNAEQTHWAVTDVTFRNAYKPIGVPTKGSEHEPARYEIQEVVEARRGLPGEVIRTVSGITAISANEWVIRRRGADWQWVVPDTRFHEVYSPCPPEHGLSETGCEDAGDGGGTPPSPSAEGAVGPSLA